MNWEGFYRNYRNPDYIPGFQILNKLGSGVFGIVYKARKESIGKDYAIKFLKVDDDSVKKAVLRELDGLNVFAQVDDPHLVSIEDKGEVDGIPYIVMGYAGEETLEKRLARRPPSRIEALEIFRQVLTGVAALHRKSIVHFDLKPGNVFLKGDFARVGDYGLSRLMSESRKSLSFSRGTPYYMAPELLRNKGDWRSDIYSLGVMLYECVTGEVPFLGDLDWEVLGKHENEKVTFPDGLDPALCKIIERMMAKKPEDRYQSLAEVITAVDAILSPGQIPAGSPDAAAAGEASRPAPVAGSRSRPTSGPAQRAGGAAPKRPRRRPHPEPAGVPGLVIGGFILALIFPFPFRLVGVILCAAGLPEAKRRRAGVGLARAGLIIGIVFCTLWILSRMGRFI